MNKPQYESEDIKIFEWPQPACEVVDKGRKELVAIHSLEDAIALRDSMVAFIKACEGEK